MTPTPPPPTPTLLPPPGPIVHAFDVHPTGEISYKPSSPTPLPQLFFDALTIRANVFILEQQCPADEEIDADDGVSWHWVIFAPEQSKSAALEGGVSNGVEGVGTARHGQATAREVEGGKLQKSTGSEVTSADVSASNKGERQPAATIRLVPSHPHPPASPPQTTPGPTYTSSKIWDQHEPYVKIGRLATVEAYRGRGYGRVLVDAALAYAGRHKEEMVRGEGMGMGMGEWKGLVLAHAQREVEGWYRGLGCEVDEGMGRWDEVGIEHVGMWRRVEVGG